MLTAVCPLKQHVYTLTQSCIRVILTFHSVPRPAQAMMLDGEGTGLSPNSKPHICEHCNAAFRSSYHLRRHVLIHTGERLSVLSAWELFWGGWSVHFVLGHSIDPKVKSSPTQNTGWAKTNTPNITDVSSMDDVCLMPQMSCKCWGNLNDKHFLQVWLIVAAVRNSVLFCFFQANVQPNYKCLCVYIYISLPWK